MSPLDPPPPSSEPRKGKGFPWLGLATGLALVVGIGLGVLFLAHIPPTLASRSRYRTFLLLVLGPPILVFAIGLYIESRKDSKSADDALKRGDPGR